MSRFGHTFGRWYVCLKDTTGHVTGKNDEDGTVYFDHDGEEVTRIRGDLPKAAECAISSALKRRNKERRLRQEVDSQR